MDRFDIAIIGSGPAGVSAAITAKIRNKKLIFFGKKRLSEKVYKAHAIKNYPGLPEIPGADLGKALEKHLETLDIEITEEQVTVIYDMGGYYSILADNKIYESNSVIVASGMTQSKQLEGENDFLGRGVSYCATCDAQFFKGKKIAVVGYHKEAEEETEFLSEVVSEVLYFPTYRDEVEFKGKENITVIRETPVAIAGQMKADVLETKDGKYEVDGIFILRESISPDQLVPGLSIVDNHIEVNLKMETNLPGCFACGDVAGKPYQYIKAAGQGNVAALSAAAYLDAKKKAEQEVK